MVLFCRADALIPSRGLRGVTAHLLALALVALGCNRRPAWEDVQPEPIVLSEAQTQAITAYESVSWPSQAITMKVPSNWVKDGETSDAAGEGQWVLQGLPSSPHALAVLVEVDVVERGPSAVDPDIRLRNWFESRWGESKGEDYASVRLVQIADTKGVEVVKPKHHRVEWTAFRQVPDAFQRVVVVLKYPRDRDLDEFREVLYAILSTIRLGTPPPFTTGTGRPASSASPSP
jgi:hypothetical protein